jgi:hypothetical protein
MASKLDTERILVQMGINLVLARLSGIFKASTSFAYPERFSAPFGARKCLSPVSFSNGKFLVVKAEKLTADWL